MVGAVVGFGTAPTQHGGPGDTTAAVVDASQAMLADAAVAAHIKRRREPQAGDHWAGCNDARAVGTAPIYRTSLVTTRRWTAMATELPANRAPTRDIPTAGGPRGVAPPFLPRYFGRMQDHPFYALHTHGLIRVAAATPTASVGDAQANAQAMLDLARKADDDGVDLIVFPELSLTSYAIDDLHLQGAMHAATLAALGEMVDASAALSPVLLVGAALPRNGRLYNCAVVIARGRILGVVPKTFLPNYREYYEKRWFASGRGLTGLTIELDGQSVPFGTDLIFAAEDCARLRHPREICEDYWAPTPPSTLGALAGATICCNLSHRTSSSARRATGRCWPPLNRRVRLAPMSIRPPGSARARPTCPGTARA